MADNTTHGRLIEDLGSELDEVRKFAVISLSQSGDLLVMPHLEKMTRDESPAVRYFARVGMDKIRRQAEPVRGEWERALDAAAGDNVDLPSWKLMLAAPDAEHRLDAAMATARLVDPSICYVIEQHLPGEPDARVRATLVRSLSRFHRPESFELLTRFLADPDNRVRANAVEALDELAEPRLQPLLEPLLSDPDNRTRGNALKALARWDRPRALQGAEAMSGALEVWMRATAIWLLRELGGDDSARLLRQMARREPGELSEKLQAALQALADRGSGVAANALRGADSGQFQALVEPPPAPPDLEELRRLLRSEAYRERMDAIEQVLRLPKDQAVELLLERLGVEDHEYVLSTLIRTLGTVGGEREVPIIAGYLRHSEPRVRANAIEGLAAIGLASIYPLVEPLLEDPNNRVRANAARVMAARDSNRAFAVLKEMLLSPDPLLADSALFALKEIGTDQILEILEIGLQNKNQEIQLKVLKVLEVLGRSHRLAQELAEKYRNRGSSGQWTTETLSSLLLKMNDAEPGVRLSALEKLAQFPDARARSRIRQATRDRDSRVRDRAHSLMGEADLEERRRALFTSLGLTAYRRMKENTGFLNELSGYRERIRDASQRLDRGENVTDSLSLRRDQVHALGERVFVLFQSGKVNDTEIEEMCRQLIALEVERERRRARGIEPTPVSWWEFLPGPFWAVLVLGVLLMALAWMLLPSTGGPIVWRKGNAPVARLAVSGELLLGAEPGAKLVAYRKSNGRVFWEASPGRKEVHAPVVANDLAYLAGDGGVLAAYRMSTGELAFSVQVQGHILAPPVAESDAVFLLVSSPPTGAAIELIDARRGTRIRRDPLGPGEGQALTVTPTTEVALLGERVLAVERASGRKIWEYRADVPCLAVPGPLNHGELTIAGAGRTVLALDLGGRPSWMQTPNDAEPLAAGPMLWRNNVVVPCGNRLFVYSAETGAPAATYELSGTLSVPRLVGDRFLYSPEPGVVSVLSLDTGRTAVVRGLGGDVQDLSADVDAIYVSTSKGLLAIRL